LSKETELARFGISLKRHAELLDLVYSCRGKGGKLCDGKNPCKALGERCVSLSFFNDPFFEEKLKEIGYEKKS